MKIKEAAKETGIREDYIRQLCRNFIIKAEPDGRSYEVDIEDLKRFLSEKEESEDKLGFYSPNKDDEIKKRKEAIFKILRETDEWKNVYTDATKDDRGYQSLFFPLVLCLNCLCRIYVSDGSQTICPYCREEKIHGVGKDKLFNCSEATVNQLKKIIKVKGE